MLPLNNFTIIMVWTKWQKYINLGFGWNSVLTFYSTLASRAEASPVNKICQLWAQLEPYSACMICWQSFAIYCTITLNIIKHRVKKNSQLQGWHVQFVWHVSAYRTFVVTSQRWLGKCKSWGMHWWLPRDSVRWVVLGPDRYHSLATSTDQTSHQFDACHFLHPATQG